MDCIFCKIANRDIPAEIVYEDDALIAFNDIDPQAPVHLLIVPKKHITSVTDISKEDGGILQSVVFAAQKLARLNNIDNSGFRIVVNSGEEGGQSVNHLHFHLLGGRQMKWPPG